MGELEVAKDVIRLEREPVIMTMKPKLVIGLANLITLETDRENFLLLCKRIEAVVRAWYYVRFEELMQLYSLFDPVNGAKKLEQQDVSPTKVDELEQRFLSIFLQAMEKSNFKILSDEELEIATSGEYLLNLPIAVDKSRLDTNLLTTYFNNHPEIKAPKYAKQYIIFRRGIGLDRTTDMFIMAKLDVLLARFWRWMIRLVSFGILFRKTPQHPKLVTRSDSLNHSETFIERISIQSMQIRLGNFFKKITIQEPTFDRIIVLYRRATPRKHSSSLGDRGIHIKQFKNIPMADMELVLPEKKSPSLTAMDWLKFLLSAVIGLVAFVGTLEKHPSDIWVALAILGGFLSYCAKIYFTFQANLVEYQRLITKSMYDKQLDSGKGSLLHLCDDVIQQEVKEVILAYFVLMTEGKATIDDLDYRSENLMREVFDEECDFEVDDAVQKLEKLGIVSKDSVGRYVHHSLSKANQIIGITTDEIVARYAS